jgi:hypothetical protein
MPDVAVLDEYCPTLPGADGRGADQGPPLGSVLPKRVVNRLRAAGKLGRVLLALRLAAPRDHLLANSLARGLDAEDLLEQGALGGPRESSGNALQLAGRAVTKGRLSIAFGALLLLSALGIFGERWRRFRSSRSG